MQYAAEELDATPDSTAEKAATTEDESELPQELTAEEAVLLKHQTILVWAYLKECKAAETLSTLPLAREKPEAEGMPPSKRQRQ